MALLDAYGNPIPAQPALRAPQTARLARYARPWHDTTLRGLKPATVAALLADADAGNLPAQAQLFADMLDRDAMIAAALEQRAMAVARLAWKIEPPPEASRAERKAAQGAQELLTAGIDALEDVRVALMDAVGYGYSAVELAWQRQGELWLPDLYPRPHDWFTASLDRRSLHLITDGGFEPLRPFGWILHQPKLPRAGYLARGGVFRALVWPFVYKAYAIGDFAEFLETFGLPFVIGKYGREATEEDKARLLSAVASLSHDARAIMPLEMQLEIQRVAASGSDSPHLAMVRWADEAIARALLGQTLSTQAKSTGLGSGVADLQAEVRRDIRDADARQLAATLTRDLVWPVCALNFGLTDPRRSPRIVFDITETEDISTYAQAIPQLAAAGVPIPVAWVRERLGIPAPAEGEAVVGAQPVPEQATAALRVAPNAGTEAETDPLDALVDEALSGWQAQIDPLMAAAQAVIDAAVRDGLTAGELMARLTDSLPDLPVDALAEALARAQFVARLGGMEGR